MSSTAWTLLLTFFVLTVSCTKNTRIDSQALGFKYHIPITPQTYDPILQKGTAAWFLLNHLYRPLISIDDKDEMQFNAAKTCHWKDTSIYSCQLKSGLQFENAKPITSKHFKNSFELVAEQSTEASGFFLKLKNQNPTQDILTPNAHTIEFVFKDFSPQDVYLLARMEFSPRLEKKLYKSPQEIISSGPFKVLDYKKNQFIVLTSNDINNSVLNTSPRPNVSVHFIEDEGTAIRMYETKRLDFIKNVPRAFFDKYKEQELHFQTMMRMDGIGISGDIINEDFKKALIYSLNFKELQKIYKSKGMPGCPALSSQLYNKNHCYEFDLDKAKKHWGKVPQELQQKLWKLNFSEVGGTDIKKGMEWFAHQWQKNLGANIRIEPLESGQFFQKIRLKDFDIIRKGIPLLTPSCAEALESFTTDSENNFVKLNNKALDLVFLNLKSTALEDLQKQKELCDEGLDELKNSYTFIPLGEMYFAFLSNGLYEGWSINSFNMLNLELLKENKTQK